MKFAFVVLAILISAQLLDASQDVSYELDEDTSEHESTTFIELTTPTIEEDTTQVSEDSHEDTTGSQTDLDSAKVARSPLFNIFVKGNLNINFLGSTGK